MADVESKLKDFHSYLDSLQPVVPDPSISDLRERRKHERVMRKFRGLGQGWMKYARQLVARLPEDQRERQLTEIEKKLRIAGMLE